MKKRFFFAIIAANTAKESEYLGNHLMPVLYFLTALAKYREGALMSIPVQWSERIGEPVYETIEAR